MLLTKTVKVKWFYKTREHYESLGYKFTKYYDEFEVPIEHLIKTANVDVLVNCDYCKQNYTTQYQNYIKCQNNSIIKKDCCIKCKSIKTEESNMLKYGVKSTNQLEETQIKKRKTNLIKYGVETVSQCSEVKEKFRSTCMDRYGVDHPMRLEETKNKVKDTVMNKYGVENILDLPEIQEKIKQTNIEKYGCENPLQNEDIKNKMIDTNLKRYGVRSTSQVKEFREKQVKTLYKNSTVKTSIQQIYIFRLVGGILNYPISTCNVDILIDENIVLEYDGGGHLIPIKNGKLTKKAHQQKELKREKFLRLEGYKIIRIKSYKDLLPEDNVILSMIDYAKEYISSGHSWIYFDINNSKIINSTGEYDYDFGQLRRLYKKNL